MLIWWLLFSMALITFANRYLFFAKSVKFIPNANLRRFLSYSSYAVLTAIWAPIVFEHNANLDIQIAGVDYLAAASLAAILSILRLPSLLIVLMSTAAFFLIRFSM